ncbi:hypothetical protein Poli38472_005281 [Pythium oligandrum]|uniref:Proteasome assembly chaperone 3 n=1 Tax=Pythium oligandrum TaxID=41045 RepID=A0A8K1CHN8_PYTOL|nr:hypothetical protein Poli38472_005281 [Pythium oligandrum]|eukprot:TMW62663.1 hypothetical protein Poli38472_005281 [Pythium oligandrum]
MIMTDQVVTELRTQQCRTEVNGVPTDFAVTIFSDRVFIVVTQLQTFGTLAYQKGTINGKFQPEIHVRLGRRDDPLLLVYARQLLEHFGVPLGLPIVAALGLKDRSSGTFEVVMSQVEKLFNLARS